MTEHFQRDLENLQKSILSLSSQVEDMIDSAGRCLCEPNRELARDVIKADKQVDQREDRRSGREMTLRHAGGMPAAAV